MRTRLIVKIDPDRCDGCGQCVPSCAEGAIVLKDGKARLLADKYCDGLGACLGECPQGAITLEEREAEEFVGPAPGAPGEGGVHAASTASAPVCPGSRVRQWEPSAVQTAGSSALRHWPVKLRLANPQAPYFKDGELLVAADCAPFAAGDFHARFLAGKVVVCGCPKFDELEEYVHRLTEILQSNDLKGITIVSMEVPCCQGLVMAVRRALEASGRRLPVSIFILGPQGQTVQQARIKAA